MKISLLMEFSKFCNLASNTYVFSMFKYIFGIDNSVPIKTIKVVFQVLFWSHIIFLVNPYYVLPYLRYICAWITYYVTAWIYKICPY